MSFWVISWLVGGLVAVLLALAMTRARGGRVAGFDVQVYKDQLNEVGRDLERGVISEIEAERSRIEVSRRLLAADRVAVGEAASMTRGGVVLAGLIAAAAIGSAFYLYTVLGAVNYPDLPLAARVAQADAARVARPDQVTAEEAAGPVTIDPTADPAHLQLMVKLREALALRPDDLQGHVLLARNEAALGDYRAAHRAQARILQIKGASAQAFDYADYADMQILAAAGYVSPEAERALSRALQLDPTNGTARYYSGLMFAQSGRPDLAFRLWRPLLEEGPPEAPWIEPVRQQIELVAADAGVNFTLPEAIALPGPDAGAVAAAGEMSAEERDEMVRGMVGRLADRLATEGGTPAEWARLISALGVLGDKAQASEIWDEAQVVFASDSSAIATVREAARQAGVAP